MVAVLADIPQRPTTPHLRLVDDRWSAPAPPVPRPVDELVRVHRPVAVATRPRPSAAVLRRRRLVAAALGVVVAVGLLFALQAALAGGGGGPLTTAAAPRGDLRPSATGSWVVGPGDTLWSIAVAVHPRGDVRPLVDQLAAELHGQPLEAGQRLTIP